MEVDNKVMIIVVVLIGVILLSNSGFTGQSFLGDLFEKEKEVRQIIEGDFNDDGCVDEYDKELLENFYGTMTTDDNRYGNRKYDLDNDGEIGSGDFVIFNNNYGKCLEKGVEKVPEIKKCYSGERCYLNSGDSALVDGRTVELLRVGSAGAIIVDVDGIQETIASNMGETINGINIWNKETFYDSINPAGSIVTIVVKEVEKVEDVEEVETAWREVEEVEIAWRAGTEDVDLGSSFVGKIRDENGVLMVGRGLKVQTSLTAQEDDYMTDVVLEADKDSIRYYLDISYGKIIGETFSLLGNKIKILEVKDRWNSMVIERDGITETIRDGDAFIGEDWNNLGWVWDLSNLDRGDPLIGIENDFIYNDDSDNPPKVGECIYLPNDYARICLDGLSVEDYEYDTYTIEYEDSADLSDAGGGYNEKAIYIHTTKREAMNLASGIYSNRTFAVYTDKIWITGDERVYYRDLDTNKVVYLGESIGINSKINTGGDTIYIGVESDRLSDSRDAMRVSFSPLSVSERIEAFFRVENNEVVGLGSVTSLDESDELTWTYGKNESIELGTKDEDHRTAYGIIIRSPRDASDEVVLDIPRRQVKAKVWMGFAGGEIPVEGCVDSDGGKDYYEPGKVTCNYPDGRTVEWYDTCSSWSWLSSKLYEYYYDGETNVGTQIPYDCPNGCEDGACIEGTLRIMNPEISYQYNHDLGGNELVSWLSMEIERGASSDIKDFKVKIDGKLYYSASQHEWNTGIPAENYVTGGCRPYGCHVTVWGPWYPGQKVKKVEIEDTLIGKRGSIDVSHLGWL